jgi:hypothetical protein
MIENIRNYTGLTFVVLVGLFLGFLFLDVGHLKGLGGDKAYIQVEGTNYDGPEFVRLGKSSLDLAYGLQMFEFIGSMGAFGGSDDESKEENFFIKRMILRNAKDTFGIHPSEEEISEAIRNNPAFANKDGKFDQEKYRFIVQQYLGSKGMAESDIRELAADSLTASKLGEILGSGLGVNDKIVAAGSALRRQQVTAQVARIELPPFKEALKPTDDEIKAYWDNIQDSFRTEPKRKFTYFVAEAKLPETKPDEAKPADPANPEKPEKPDPTKEDPKVLEERQRKQQEFAEKFEDMLNELQLKKGANFEELAKNINFEIKSTELFPASLAPAELAVPIYKSSRGGRIVDFLFNMKETSDPFSKISEPLEIGDNKWLVARLDGEEPSRVKTFEEARDQARQQFIEEKAREAMRKSADEQLKKIREAVTAGKSFADAAKEAGLETKTVGPVTASTRPSSASEPQALFGSTSLVDPGTVADLLVEPAQIFIAFVEKREVIKQPDPAASLKSEVSSAASVNQRIALDAWLTERLESAKVERLNRR